MRLLLKIGALQHSSFKVSGSPYSGLSAVHFAAGVMNEAMLVNEIYPDQHNKLHLSC